MQRASGGVDWLFWRPATHPRIKDGFEAFAYRLSCGELAEAWRVCEFFDLVEEEQARKYENRFGS